MKTKMLAILIACMFFQMQSQMQSDNRPCHCLPRCLCQQRPDCEWLPGWFGGIGGDCDCRNDGDPVCTYPCPRNLFIENVADISC
jgi:hypothetical protein